MTGQRLPADVLRFLICRYFDFERLKEVTHSVAKNLNKIIDNNFYPVEAAKRSNMRHRPIGIGIQVSPCLLFPEAAA